jgi:hypothetical protein
MKVGKWFPSHPKRYFKYLDLHKWNKEFMIQYHIVKYFSSVFSANEVKQGAC